MAAFLNIFSSFQRLRHKYGFGIHSPFAYHFITEVLNQRHGYYAYAQLHHKHERLVFRVALYFRPGRVVLMAPELASASVSLAMPAAIIGNQTDTDLCDRDLAVCDAASADPRAVDTLLTAVKCRNLPAIILNHSKINNLQAFLEQLPHGMTFDNHRDAIIIVPRPTLPRQDFAVAF